MTQRALQPAKRKKPVKKKRGWLVGLAVLIALAVLLSLGKRGFIQQIRLEQNKEALAQEIEDLEKEKATLQAEKDTLQTPEYTEKIAREKYGMAKKGEKVYQVVPKKGN